MVPELTDPSLGVSPSQGSWVPDTGRGSGVGPLSLSPTRQDDTGLVHSYGELVSPTNVIRNSMNPTQPTPPFSHLRDILHLVSVLVGLCGVAGNGAVVWLLGFRLKRSPFSVYILNLACADGTFLLSNSVHLTILLVRGYTQESRALVLGVWSTSYLAGLGLLMAVSTERCVSALCPLWHRCRRPAHLSCAVCALVWGLALCAAILERMCDVTVGIPCNNVDLFYEVMAVVTFLVLCVSSLTLLVRVQCGSRGTRHSRLYVSILLTVLAFLLLGLPYTVHFFVSTISPSTADIPALLPILELLFALNSTVNPIIYFFVGRYRQRPGKTRLQDVLQRALREEEATEQSGTQLSTYTTTST